MVVVAGVQQSTWGKVLGRCWHVLCLGLLHLRVMCNYSHVPERDRPLLVGAVVIPPHDVW